MAVSDIFQAKDWQEVAGFALGDVTYHESLDGQTVRIALNRPECRNAFRPQTVDELYQTLLHAAENPRVGTVLLTGNGPSPKDGGWAFSSGGDQRVRGKDGYKYDAASDPMPTPQSTLQSGGVWDACIFLRSNA